MSTEEDESDERGTAADDPGNVEESTADDPGNVEESTADDPVSGHWLYIGIGLLTAVVAWLLIPLFGIGPVYAGYKLYDSEERTISAAILVVLGVLPLVFWVLFIFQTL